MGFKGLIVLLLLTLVCINSIVSCDSHEADAEGTIQKELSTKDDESPALEVTSDHEDFSSKKIESIVAVKDEAGAASDNNILGEHRLKDSLSDSKTISGEEMKSSEAQQDLPPEVTNVKPVPELDDVDKLFVTNFGEAKTLQNTFDDPEIVKIDKLSEEVDNTIKQDSTVLKSTMPREKIDELEEPMTAQKTIMEASMPLNGSGSDFFLAVNDSEISSANAVQTKSLENDQLEVNINIVKVDIDTLKEEDAPHGQDDIDSDDQEVARDDSVKNYADKKEIQSSVNSIIDDKPADIHPEKVGFDEQNVDGVKSKSLEDDQTREGIKKVNGGSEDAESHSDILQQKDKEDETVTIPNRTIKEERNAAPNTKIISDKQGGIAPGTNDADVNAESRTETDSIQIEEVKPVIVQTVDDPHEEKKQNEEEAHTFQPLFPDNADINASVEDATLDSVLEDKKVEALPSKEDKVLALDEQKSDINHTDEIGVDTSYTEGSICLKCKSTWCEFICQPGGFIDTISSKIFESFTTSEDDTDDGMDTIKDYL